MRPTRFFSHSLSHSLSQKHTHSRSRSHTNPCSLSHTVPKSEGGGAASSLTHTPTQPNRQPRSRTHTNIHNHALYLSLAHTQLRSLTHTNTHKNVLSFTRAQTYTLCLYLSLPPSPSLSLRGREGGTLSSRLRAVSPTRFPKYLVQGCRLSGFQDFRLSGFQGFEIQCLRFGI